MKTKQFGKVFALEFWRGVGKGKAYKGVSICTDIATPHSEFDGDWLTLAEAKRLRKNLNDAIVYIEAEKAKK